MSFISHYRTALSSFANCVHHWQNGDDHLAYDYADRAESVLLSHGHADPEACDALLVAVRAHVAMMDRERYGV